MTTSLEDTSGRLTIATALIGLTILPCLYYVAIFASFVLRARKLGKVLDQIPGYPKHWLTGTLHLMPKEREKGIAHGRETVKKFPRLSRHWMGPFVCIISAVHPDTVKTVFKSTEPKQLGFGPGYGMLRSWLGDGLLLASGQKWQRNRRLLTPAFHFDVLRPYMEISNKAADILLDKLTTASKSGESVEICRPVCLCTLDVILQCAFSYDEDIQRKGESHPYSNSIFTMTKLIMQRYQNPLLYLDFVYQLTPSGRRYQSSVDFVHKVSREIVAARQKILKENGNAVRRNKHPDFLDILLLAKDEDGKGLTDTEINDEVDTFLFEGHDTTASAISWILYELARHPEHQEECRQEIDSVLEGRSINDILWDDLQEIPYLSMCIKEAMRLNAPVPVVARKTSTDFYLDGFLCPKGTIIEILIHQLHTNSVVWGDDALEFKPERFHHDQMQHMDPYAFVPFAAGLRNCIGQNFAMHEIKVVVAKVLHRFEFHLDQNHRVDRLVELVMRAKDGIHIFFKTRSKAR